METCKIKINNGYKFDHTCINVPVERLYTIFERAFNSDSPWADYQRILRNHSICSEKCTSSCSINWTSIRELVLNEVFCTSGMNKEEILKKLNNLYDESKRIDNQIKYFKSTYMV